VVKEERRLLPKLLMVETLEKYLDVDFLGQVLVEVIDEDLFDGSEHGT